MKVAYHSLPVLQVGSKSPEYRDPLVESPDTQDQAPGGYYCWNRQEAP
jgi:hypothetical protein